MKDKKQNKHILEKLKQKKITRKNKKKVKLEGQQIYLSLVLNGS